MSVTHARAVTPSRPLIEGPSVWTGADMRAREAEWSHALSPIEIAGIETAVPGGAPPRSRYRRHPPGGFSAALAWPGAGPAAERSAAWPRFRASARPAGRGVADRGKRGRVLGCWRLFRQRARRTRRGICSGMCMIWAAAAPPIPTRAVTRPPSGRIITSTVAMSWRCCVCGARNRAGCPRSSVR